MINTLLETILQDTFIKTLALKKITALKDHLLKQHFSSSKQNFPESDSDNPQIATWISTLEPTLFTDIDQKNIYTTFDKLENDVKTIEPLILYLPYELPEEMIAEIGRKLREDYGKNFLIDIQIKPDLVAGAALSYKGMYRDYSVKQIISDNKKTILATFRKYIKH